MLPLGEFVKIQISSCRKSGTKAFTVANVKPPTVCSHSCQMQSSIRCFGLRFLEIEMVTTIDTINMMKPVITPAATPRIKKL